MGLRWSLQMEAQESGWIEFKSKDKRKLMLLLKNREQILLSPPDLCSIQASNGLDKAQPNDQAEVLPFDKPDGGDAPY